MKTVLTIAGSDPSGGAGVQADLKTFADLGVRGLSAITALTAQAPGSVTGVMATTPRFLTKQVETLLEAYTVHAVKVGMLYRTELVETTARLVKRSGLENIVLDPVLRSSSGYPLLEKKAINALKMLLPLVRVVTPNIHEAALLSGLKVKDTGGMEEAARVIFSLGPENVLVTGGHLKATPVDILYDGKKFSYNKGRRLTRSNLHGTGCILSSAIAAGLARGRTVERAVRDAKSYVTGVIRARP